MQIRNGEGYADPTASAALNRITKEESESEKRAITLLRTIKCIIGLAGFELLGRIEIRDRRNGRKYK